MLIVKTKFVFCALIFLNWCGQFSLSRTIRMPRMRAMPDAQDLLSYHISKMREVASNVELL